MTGNTDCANLAYLLPVPQITSNGEVEVTTLLSCKGWKDWFLYDDAAWEDCSNSDETIQVTVSNNSAAFRPMAIWTVLGDSKGEPKDDTKDKPKDESKDK